MFDRAARSTVSAAVALVLACASGLAVGHDDDHDRGGRHDRDHQHDWKDHRGEDADPITLTPLATFDAGGAGSAEIVEYDAQSRRLFVVNAQTRTVDILDVRNPKLPSRITTIDTAAFGAPNSVAVRDGVVAVAIESNPKTDPGRVAFYKVSGQLTTTVRVGSLPDMLTFTPDGEHLLVANEGEPSGYGTGHVDPQGSVSIIPIPRSQKQLGKLKDTDVRTVSFTQFNGQEANLRAQGIRIYGPGATAAQDFEPEYIAVSEDSRKAYVTLQENNAIAEIDIRKAQVSKLRPLGYKDYDVPPQTAATYEWAERPVIGSTAAGQKLRLEDFPGSPTKA